MSKKQIISLGALGLLTAGVFLLPSVVDAYRGDPSIEGPDCTAQRHEVITAAFAKAHQLAQEGKVEEAKQIRAELGLGLGNGAGKDRSQGQGQGRGQGQMNRRNR